VLRTFLSSVFGDTAPLETPKGDAEASKLQWMPDYNFQAFIRKDVSTFYGEESGSRGGKEPCFHWSSGKVSQPIRSPARSLLG